MPENLTIENMPFSVKCSGICFTTKFLFNFEEIISYFYIKALKTLGNQYCNTSHHEFKCVQLLISFTS